MFPKPFSLYLRYAIGSILLLTFVAIGFLPSVLSQAASSIKVQIDKGGGTDNTQETTFNFLVKNTGTAAVSGLSTRIYFTPDGSNAASGYMLEKYYDQSGAATISGPTLLSGTTYYFTVSYGTASLAAGGQWEFQTALHLSSWASTYSGANDYYHTGYAVGALPAAYTDTNYITAYVSGALAWGTEPGGTPGPTATFIPPTITVIPPTSSSAKTTTPVPPTNTMMPSATPTLGSADVLVEGHVFAPAGCGGGVPDSGDPIYISFNSPPPGQGATPSAPSQVATADANGNYFADLGDLGGQRVGMTISAGAPAGGSSSYVWFMNNAANEPEHWFFSFGISGPTMPSSTPQTSGSTNTPTATDTTCPYATPTLIPVTPSSSDITIEGHATTIGACGPVPLSGVGIWRSFNDTPSSEIAVTDSNGYYSANLGNAMGQPASVIIFASLGDNGIFYYPGYVAWQHPAGQSEHKVIDFTDYPNVITPTPSATCTTTITPTPATATLTLTPSVIPPTVTLGPSPSPVPPTKTSGALPDLTIPSTLSVVCPAGVVVPVSNIGQAAAGSFVVTLTNGTTTATQTVSGLTAGASANVTFASGPFGTDTATVNPNHTVVESNYANNSATQNMVPPPCPAPTLTPTKTTLTPTMIPTTPGKTITPLPPSITPNPTDPCASPTVITGGGSFNVTTATTCFKYVNTAFVNGGMFSIMKDATSTSDTIKWYGGKDQNATSCANQSSTISGNGGQLNNFTVAKDANGQMFLIITGTGSNSVTISIQNWQNGARCSVKPTVHP